MNSFLNRFVMKYNREFIFFSIYIAIILNIIVLNYVTCTEPNKKAKHDKESFRERYGYDPPDDNDDLIPGDTFDPDDDEPYWKELRKNVSKPAVKEEEDTSSSSKNVGDASFKHYMLDPEVLKTTPEEPPSEIDINPGYTSKSEQEKDKDSSKEVLESIPEEDERR